MPSASGEELANDDCAPGATRHVNHLRSPTVTFCTAAARLVALLLAVLIVPAGALAEPSLKVCTFSFHGPTEVQAFASSLPREDFELIDLSPPPLLRTENAASPAPPAVTEQASEGRRAPWLLDLCHRGLECDVEVYSGEFAGSFFGASGTSLSLQAMEEASCQSQCRGLFRRPREVFLLACNTLATKDQDRRSPQEYLQVLLDHGFDRAAAERVVAARYGPLGPSFRETFRRIFAGVPRIYGFSSVAPTGEYTAPMLEKYFRTKGDYARYLEQAGRDTGPNQELLKAFDRTGLVQLPGLSPDEPAAADRDQICALYDETASVAERLRIVERLMSRADLLAFLPSIETFVNRHPVARLGAAERQIFARIAKLEDARRQVVALVQELDVSALKLELAHLALHLGWMTDREVKELAVDAARRLLSRSLTSEVLDTLCEISRHEFIGDRFGSEDLPDRLFASDDGIRLVDCVSSTDRRVSGRLVAGLDNPDLSTRLWAGYALSRRLPLADPILLELARHLDDPSQDLRDRLRWVFKVQKPLSEPVRRAIARRDHALAEELARER